MTTTSRRSHRPDSTTDAHGSTSHPTRSPGPLGPPRGRTLLAGVAAGGGAAVVLTMTAFAGADEAVTTGAVLLGFAVGWAVMAHLGRRRSGEPQRWAAVPGIAMGVTGAALVLADPGAQVMDTLSWAWPPLLLGLVAWVWTQLRRSVPGHGRWALVPVLVVLALASVGAVAGNIVVARDRARYAAAGELYEVHGHRLHLDCRGSGSPTVVLSNSLGGTSADWARVMAAVSPQTRICGYDRAGQGWSEEAAPPRDGVQSATELRTLLDRAGEHGPYVLAGYSTGGTYAMTYAARYPGDVAGMVLLDSSSPEQFTRMPAFAAQYQMMRRTYGPLSTLSRTGILHLLPGASPLPGRWGARVDAVSSAPKAYRNQRDEVSLIPTVFRQARALTTLGDRPLVVLTASENAERTTGWTGAQDALAALSTNSDHRTVAATHLGMVGDVGPAAAAVRAIADVVTSIRHHDPLPAR